MKVQLDGDGGEVRPPDGLAALAELVAARPGGQFVILFVKCLS
ncbi:MAG TPA: hypothetical protein VF071_02325 [Candidatus Limnocylindria bacterium]